jgi:hypothetical protein
MNSFKTWATAVALSTLSIFGSSVRADAPSIQPERVRTLVRQLDDDRFSVRRDADQALRGLGVPALPLLRTEVENAPSLEARRRLEAVIDELSRLHWQRDLDVALRQAKETGKPLLVFSAAGLQHVPMTLESAAMQQRTFTDLNVVAYLNANFVLVWHDPTPGEVHARQVGRPIPQFTPQQVQEWKDGTGTSIHTFLCAPDGCVLQHLLGFHGPEGLLKEAARTPELARGPRPRPATQVAAAGPVQMQSHEMFAAAGQVQALQMQEQVLQLAAKPVRGAPLAPVGNHVWDVVVELERSLRVRLSYGC